MRRRSRVGDRRSLVVGEPPCGGGIPRARKHSDRDASRWNSRCAEGGTDDRLVEGDPPPRRGWDGRRLSRGAGGRAVSPARRAQVHSPRACHRRDGPPLPARAPDPRIARPSEHGAAPRRRNDRRGAPLAGHGVRGRRGALRVVFRARADAPRAASPLPRSLRRGGSGASATGAPPRHQAGERACHRRRLPAPPRFRGGEDLLSRRNGYRARRRPHHAPRAAHAGIREPRTVAG